MDHFKLVSEYSPTGDQPQAIKSLSEGVNDGLREQILLGVTGSGKTYTMANIIANVNKPTLVLAHNKILAAQLCSEFRELFPENAVEYFVSYYDYYQPEAYIPSTNTHIEKDTSINSEIDRLRHSATAALFERRDVIIVSSVSCLYGLGDPEDYLAMTISLRPGMCIDRQEISRRLADISYVRSADLSERGSFSVKGDTLLIHTPDSDKNCIRIEFFDDEIERILEYDSVTGKIIASRNHVAILPATHHATTENKMKAAIGRIEAELEERLNYFIDRGKIAEAQILERITRFDIAMLRETKTCSGIENYSRHIAGRPEGSPPYTLLDYFPEDFLLFIDESHATIPQLRAMYHGDRARKKSLIDYGYRLPSAYDNRPLNFDEFNDRVNQVIFVSATPAQYEYSVASNIAEQIIRPTGLPDPQIFVRPVEGQIDDLVSEIKNVTDNNERVLVTTLTKKMAENLSEYLQNIGIKAKYMHSEIKTIERMELIRDLRMGEFDVLVGINLLREGLDLPEVSLIAILDADKEGFLRSTTSLIQIVGRAARNVNGKVIMYGDTVTPSMEFAINETKRRRDIQVAYNTENGIIPITVKKTIHDIIESVVPENKSGTKGRKNTFQKNQIGVILSDEEQNMPVESLIQYLTDKMNTAAAELKFEEAAQCRDAIKKLRGLLSQKTVEI